jgi:hypothetical protein
MWKLLLRSLHLHLQQITLDSTDVLAALKAKMERQRKIIS